MPIIFHGTGSGGSAKKLKTARTINGTNFDGTANITTANWGTTRTVTVGNTSKSVNGSGNVSWSLAEIGIHLSTTEPAASDGKNGDIWIKYKDDTSQNEIDVNKSELEKEGLKTDIEINNDNGQGNIEINENK